MDKHRQISTHTHTHTYIYIYIYIINLVVWNGGCLFVFFMYHTSFNLALITLKNAAKCFCYKEFRSLVSRNQIVIPVWIWSSWNFGWSYPQLLLGKVVSFITSILCSFLATLHSEHRSIVWFIIMFIVGNQCFLSISCLIFVLPRCHG